MLILRRAHDPTCWSSDCGVHLLSACSALERKLSTSLGNKTRFLQKEIDGHLLEAFEDVSPAEDMVIRSPVKLKVCWEVSSLLLSVCQPPCSSWCSALRSHLQPVYADTCIEFALQVKRESFGRRQSMGASKPVGGFSRFQEAMRSTVETENPGADSSEVCESLSPHIVP